MYTLFYVCGRFCQGIGSRGREWSLIRCDSKWMATALLNGGHWLLTFCSAQLFYIGSQTFFLWTLWAYCEYCIPCKRTPDLQVVLIPFWKPFNLISSCPFLDFMLSSSDCNWPSKESQCASSWFLDNCTRDKKMSKWPSRFSMGFWPLRMLHDSSRGFSLHSYGVDFFESKIRSVLVCFLLL